MNLYTRLPFGKFHARQPEIIAVAEAIGRTPGALAMKLCNLASFDPAHRLRGVGGLKNTSRSDHAIWEQFERDWTSMALRSEQAYDEMVTPLPSNSPPDAADDNPDNYTGDTIPTTVERRVGQQFFRRAVLTAYQDRCCITGNPIPQLLTASHIQPWAAAANNRLNPRNGLCLAKTQDAAFDKGLITLDEAFKLVLSPCLRDHFDVPTIQDNFAQYSGKTINLPDRFAPEPRFLEYHRNEVYVS